MHDINDISSKAHVFYNFVEKLAITSGAAKILKRLE